LLVCSGIQLDNLQTVPSSAPSNKEIGERIVTRIRKNGQKSGGKCMHNFMVERAITNSHALYQKPYVFLGLILDPIHDLLRYLACQLAPAACWPAIRP